jgi:hypothetical protein
MNSAGSRSLRWKWRLYLVLVLSFVPPAYSQVLIREDPPASAQARQQRGDEKSATPHQHPAPPPDKAAGVQTPEHDHSKMEKMSMPEMETADLNPSGIFLMEQGSGTSVNPGSSPMHMKMINSRSWNFMFHGSAFIGDIQQSGPRGGDKLFSANWFMGMAHRQVGRGSFMVRAMLSLEPATVTERQYPLLFQTGEAAFGKAIVDGQHPHDLFMELSVQYARPIGEKTLVDFYVAPVGDPALGPVAYPHRVSAAELPQATLSHHLQDSSHIVNEVLTAGLKFGIVRIEGSGFHGREPNENRWNIDHGAIDSWSTRLTLTPASNWSGQVSVGRLKHPEELEPSDIVRSTASVTYNLPLASGHWATSVIWGRNHKVAERRNINSYLVESVIQFHNKSYLTGRIELVDKDELFDNQPEVKENLARTVGSVFRIQAYTLGYTRDIKEVAGIKIGLGGNFSTYGVPSAIKPFYGNHPVGFMMYLRLRLKGDDHLHHHHGP